MPAYGPGAIINQGGRPTYGGAVASLLDAIQGRQNQQAAIDDQKKQQAQAAREARVKGVMEDLSRVPASKVQEYIAQLPPDVQEDVRNHGRGLIQLPMTSDEYAEQARVRDFTELGKIDPTDPREKAAAEARRYRSMFKADLPNDQWQTAMTGNLQGATGLTDANRIANKQQVTADEAADNSRADREMTDIKLPESKAKIGSENALTGERRATSGLRFAETSLTNAKTGALKNSGINPDTGAAVPFEQAPAVVRLLVNRDYDPSLIRRWKPAEGEQVLRQVLTYDPHFSMQDYVSEVQAKKDFTSGKESQNIKAINTAIHHIATAEDAAKKMANRSFTPWNTVANKTLDVFGSSTPNDFRVAMQNALTPEMAAVFKGGGATDQEIKSWREVASTSSSPEQIQGVLRRMAELMAGRTKGIINKWHVAFDHGPNPKPVPQFIGAGEKAILTKYGFEIGDDAETIGGNGNGGSPGAERPITDPNEALAILKKGHP